MKDFIRFLVEENSFTVYLFWISLLVDVYAIYLFNKCVKHSGLFAFLIVNIVAYLLINSICLSKGMLINIAPLTSIILVWVLYRILKEIYNE